MQWKGEWEDISYILLSPIKNAKIKEQEEYKFQEEKLEQAKWCAKIKKWIQIMIAWNK